MRLVTCPFAARTPRMLRFRSGLTDRSDREGGSLRAVSVTLLIRGGIVVSEREAVRSDVLVKDGRIQAVGTNLQEPGAEVIEAAGRWVLPGGVDPHVHIQVQFDRFETDETPESCSQAALYGGTTTLLDFAIPRPGQSSLEAVRERLLMAERCFTDTRLHGCVNRWADGSRRELEGMRALGVRNIKVFTTYEGILKLPERGIREVLRFVAASDGVVLVHAEDDQVIAKAHAELSANGSMSSVHHGRSRPIAAETEAVRRILAMPETRGATVYFVHLSTHEAVKEIRKAREAGISAFAETCPHYLVFDESVYTTAQGPGFVCCPPIRSADVVEGLLGEVFDGSIDAIGSDHCCFLLRQKRESSLDVRHMPYGLPGVETRLPVLFSELVVARGMPPPGLRPPHLLGTGSHLWANTREGKHLGWVRCGHRDMGPLPGLDRASTQPPHGDRLHPL